MLEEKLTKLRRKQGLSQQDVADALGVSRQTISNWECGQGAPALDKALEIARLYHVSLDDLSDDVEVVTASRSAAGRDLHVLRALEGRTCRVAFADSSLAMTVGSGNPLMRVLEATGDWIKVEYERASGLRKKERVLQLIEVDAVESICLEEGCAS